MVRIILLNMNWQKSFCLALLCAVCRVSCPYPCRMYIARICSYNHSLCVCVCSISNFLNFDLTHFKLTVVIIPSTHQYRNHFSVYNVLCVRLVGCAVLQMSAGVRCLYRAESTYHVFDAVPYFLFLFANSPIPFNKIYGYLMRYVWESGKGMMPVGTFTQDSIQYAGIRAPTNSGHIAPSYTSPI